MSEARWLLVVAVVCVCVRNSNRKLNGREDKRAKKNHFIFISSAVLFIKLHAHSESSEPIYQRVPDVYQTAI